MQCISEHNNTEISGLLFNELCILYVCEEEIETRNKIKDLSVGELCSEPVVEDQSDLLVEVVGKIGDRKRDKGVD